MPLRSIVSALLRRVRLAIDRAHYEAWGVPLTYAGRHRSVQ